MCLCLLFFTGGTFLLINCGTITIMTNRIFFSREEFISKSVTF